MNRTRALSVRPLPLHLTLALLLALAALLAAGCGKKVTELENKVAQLEQEREELQQYVSDQDQHAIEIANSVDDVLTRVTEITARQGRLRIEAHQAELGAAGDVSAAKESILEEIEWLDEQLEENRMRLAELTAQIADLEGAGQRQAARIVQLEKMIGTQELLITDLRVDAERMEARSAALVAEKTQVEEEKEAVSQELAQLSDVHQDLRDRYDTLEDDVGYGYVFIGQKKEIKALKKIDVLQDRGKLVVAGSGLEGDAPDSYFHKVSVVASEIRLGPVGERIEVLSPHREQAQNFWFERKEDDLYMMLRDPGSFWSASHYLVLRER